MAVFPFFFYVDEKGCLTQNSDRDNTYSIRDIRHHAVACKEFRLDTQCLVTEQGLTDIHHIPAREGGIFDLLLNDGIS